jgi:hypothetical protein
MTIPSPAASRFHTSVTRRVLGAFAALALAGGLAAGPSLAASASGMRAPATTRTMPDGGAVGLVESLDDDEAEQLRGGSPNVAGTGLRLGDLDETRRAAVFALLQSLLSPAGWAELSDLLDADAVIGAQDAYRLALFGDPAADYVLQFSTADVILSAIHQGDTVDVRPDVAV